MNQAKSDYTMNRDLEKEIQKHHKFLKQFIDLSYDASASMRKNSRRATKAREKLLKLSQAQFTELSTDVYDELNRRINESKEEPDFLLPRDSFHPKRNQAREKLASLPAQRFKDLVNDILYEIERRDLHLSRGSYGEQDFNGATFKADERADSNEHALQAAQHGVQSKTVIPTKANMAWSSDEEEEDGHVSDGFVERSLLAQNQAEEPKTDSSESKDIVSEMAAIGSPSQNKHSSNSSIKRGLSINKEREIQMLLEEGTKMDGKITDLEELLEVERQKVRELQSVNESLLEQAKTKDEEHQNQISMLNSQISQLPNKNKFMLLESQYNALQSSHGIVTDEHSSLLREVEQLKAENESLHLRHTSLQNTREVMSGSGSGIVSDEAALQKIQEQLYQLAHNDTDSPMANNYDEIKAERDAWKDRFEKACSGRFETELNKADVSSEAFQEFVSESGQITMRQLADFQASVEAFYIDFNRPDHNKNDLFRAVSLIATRADLMCNDVSADRKAVSLVRACISHSIVVARHYLSFEKILPSIVLNIAVNDIALSICDLVKSVKLSTSDTRKALPSSKPDIATPTLRDFNAPASFLDNNETSSPVRPLKMIERLNSPAAGVSSKMNDSERGTSESIFSLTEKRQGISNSPLAPINTHVANGIQKDAAEVNTPQASVASPRGPGIIALAGKLGNNNATKVGISKASPEGSPSSKNISERVKKFESPEQEPVQSGKKSLNLSNSSVDAFAKFGAKRRSSIANETAATEANHTKEVPGGPLTANKSEFSPTSTDVDLNEIPSHNELESYQAARRAPLHEYNPPNVQHEDGKNGINDHVAELDYDKVTVAANFNVEDFNILNPDNTLHELLLYLEHQTMDVISTIQTLLASIKKQDTTRGVLRDSARAINVVVGQMTEATNISMNQTRNVQLREHGTWVVQNLEDCGRRMEILCGPNNKISDSDYADKNFKQRLAGVAFDIAKSTKELVKSVEEASLKHDISMLDARLNR